MLEMRTRCEQCGTDLGHQANAFICSYECTFCEPCAAAINARCRNCGDELLPRPKRMNETCRCGQATRIKNRSDRDEELPARKPVNL